MARNSAPIAAFAAALCACNPALEHADRAPAGNGAAKAERIAGDGDSLAAVLDEIEMRGGVEPYLALAGVSSEELSTLRARLTAD